jgi:hypothetical protein
MLYRAKIAKRQFILLQQPVIMEPAKKPKLDLQAKRELENAKRRARRASETEEEKLTRRSKRNEQDRARRARKSVSAASQPQGPALLLPVFSVASERTRVEQKGELWS